MGTVGDSGGWPHGCLFLVWTGSPRSRGLGITPGSRDKQEQNIKTLGPDG